MDDIFGEISYGAVNSVPADADYEFPILLANDGGKVTASWRDADNTAQKIMLIGFDANGNVVGGKVGDSVAAKGIVTAEWDILSNVKTVKAYALNGAYTDLRPLAAPKTLTVK